MDALCSAASRFGNNFMPKRREEPRPLERAHEKGAGVRRPSRGLYEGFGTSGVRCFPLLGLGIHPSGLNSQCKCLYLQWLRSFESRQNRTIKPELEDRFCPARVRQKRFSEHNGPFCKSNLRHRGIGTICPEIMEQLAPIIARKTVFVSADGHAFWSVLRSLAAEPPDTSTVAGSGRSLRRRYLSSSRSA